jgi:hypothetical protein
MPRLRNLRQVEGRHGPEMAADFTIADGRIGCVTVPLDEFNLHGERTLQQQADAAEREARIHGYRPPEHDRYAEL